MKKIITIYLNSWWLPILVYLCLLGGVVVPELLDIDMGVYVETVLLAIAGIGLLGIIVAAIWNLSHKRPEKGVVNLLLFFVGCAATVFAFGLLLVTSMFGPSEDGFADHLTIPAGIDIAEPEPGLLNPSGDDVVTDIDDFQQAIRESLAVPGTRDASIIPALPALQRASTVHPQLFQDYIDASVHWHVFTEQGNRFAARRWINNGIPRDTLHGYISEFDGNERFQTRCLIFLDGKQWGGYSVSHVAASAKPVEPQLSMSNELHESRMVIEAGAVGVEIFEQSSTPERRVTKATIAILEKEFAEFEQDPEASLAQARSRARQLGRLLAGTDSQPFRLHTGMQPGIYEVVYSLNPGEAGAVYLKAFEVTLGTPLSAERLEMASKTRMAWSMNAGEVFGAKAGFSIYEGDWGKPYAARFEVWFIPDTGKSERKLAERVFKIEGWQR